MSNLYQEDPWAGWAIATEDTDRIAAANDGDLLLVTFTHDAAPDQYWLKALVRVGLWRDDERETDVVSVNEYAPALARHLAN